MVTPIQAANYFIEKSISTGIELTPMKLVKLVYIAHGWYLGLTGKPLLSEAVIAWQYGPVITSLYKTFKKYGGKQIITLESDNERGTIPMIETEEIKQLLDKVWQVYGKYSGVQLSSLTHQKDSPWYQSFDKFGQNAIIPHDMIEQHYKAKIHARTPIAA